MSWRRARGHRKDENHDEIVRALRAVGCVVAPIGRPCDLLVRYRGNLYLLDVDGIAKYRKRDPKQLAAFEQFGVRLVKTRADAFAAIGIPVDASALSDRSRQ